MRKIKVFNILLVLLLLSYQSFQSKAPFIETNELHQAKSQFQVNIIFNQNRNFPILFIQYSKDNSKYFIVDMVKGAFEQEPDIAFAVLVDCRQFQYNLNNTIGICVGFKDYVEEQTLTDQQKIQNDVFFRFEFLSPSSSRIKQKGHLLLKNHDSQNLRQLNNQFNSAFLAKVIRNEVPDFVSYIEQQFDFDQFLQLKSSFRSSKLAKLLYFDQNLQAPLFLKKLAVKLDGRIKIGVTDSYKLLKKYNSQFENIILLEYDFIQQGYQSQKIKYRENKQIEDILSDRLISKYLAFKKPRDMLLDFQHVNYAIYNISSLNQINQLISYGRVVFLEISTSQENFQCSNLEDLASKHNIFFNYICLNRKTMKQFFLINGKQLKPGQLFIIDSSLKEVNQVNYDQNFNVYDHLPRVPPRQKVSASSQMQLCIKTALNSNRDPILYWYNQKSYKDVLKLLQYFNSLPQITSFIHFCQIYLPEDDIKKQFSLQQNSMFSLINPDRNGQMQKFQYSNALTFHQIKMFLREMGINKILKVYEDKLLVNSLTEINTAQELTKYCFSNNCIIAFLATNKFRLDKQMTILKQLKLQFSQIGYSFYWIDGVCHWDIAKQLKLVPKKQKLIEQSYIFYYKQKDNNYSLMKNIQSNKYWNKKDVTKWLKSLKDQKNISRLRFGIDIEERKCEPIKEVQKVPKSKPSKQKQTVNQNQL